MIYAVECNCHGHSDECYYNQTVADLKLSLNMENKTEGGGVCIGCRVSIICSKISSRNILV